MSGLSLNLTTQIDAMKKEIFTNLEIQDLEDLIRICIRAELKEMTNNNENADLMKANEVCEYLRISKVTLFNWLRQGKIIGYHLGTRLFFKRTDVDKALIKVETKK